MRHNKWLNASINPYAGHRYPAEIISHTVWLYFRFALSFRDVEELLAARGVILTYETIRQWCLKFGQPFANEIRHRQGRPSDTWFLDQGKKIDNRAEVSHQPTRQRERQMRRFKLARHAQRFLSAHGPINNLYRLDRHHMKSAHYRLFRDRVFDMWQRVTCVRQAS